MRPRSAGKSLARSPAAHRPLRTSNPCLFWERGRCDRGVNCNFYHDPSIRQNDAHQVEAAQRDTELELAVHLAHAAALLGRRKACKPTLLSGANGKITTVRSAKLMPHAAKLMLWVRERQVNPRPLPRMPSRMPSFRPAKLACLRCWPQSMDFSRICRR